MRAHRGDMIIRLAPGTPAAFRENVAADRAAGYRVDVVVLAVRAADSRQGIAVRYAHNSREGAARYTSASGHDVCLQALHEAIAACERGHLVDNVTVLRRDHTALYRNQLSPSGRWIHPPRAAAVLLAEQHRPYTAGQAAAFLAVQCRLLNVIPQYRADLQDITRLARPLLPAWVQPRSLEAHPARTLPVPLRPGR